MKRSFSLWTYNNEYFNENSFNNIRHKNYTNGVYQYIKKKNHIIILNKYAIPYNITCFTSFGQEKNLDDLLTREWRHFFFTVPWLLFSEISGLITACWFTESQSDASNNQMDTIYIYRKVIALKFFIYW